MLVLSIALAMPVQGVAAVSARLCMGLGHHDGVAAASHAHADEAAEHTHDQAAGGDAHCAPCVACCAAASISGATEAVPRVLATAAVDVPPLPLLADFLPVRLDRPPLAL